MKTYNYKTISTLALSLTISMSLSSCGLFGGDERPVYQGAEYYKNLEVPPDLTEPDTADQLRVPTASDEAMQRFRDNHKLETVVTPKFDGVRMVNYAGNSWLEIDNDADFVWSRLHEFWQSEGIDVIEDRPLLGYMETDWTERLGPEEGFFTSIFQKFEPDQKDKFRVRLERFDDGKRTRMYIANSRIEKVLKGEYNDTFIWVSLPSNIEAEREILSRMAVFAGLNDAQRLALLENYRPYTSLVKIERSDNTALTMTGSMDFVWHRAMRALDRMQMKDIRQDQQNSTIHFSVREFTKQEQGIEEDELSKSSWMMQLFTGSSDEDISDKSSRQYRLEFREVEGRIRISVLDEADTINTDEEGNVSGTALGEQLRDLLAKNLE